MKVKLTQQDLVVLALIGRDGWTQSYLLNGKQFGNHWLGAQSDKRLYELFDCNVTDCEEKSAKRVIDGAEYTIITKKLDGRRVYKAFLSKEKPMRPTMRIEIRNGAPVAVYD